MAEYYYFAAQLPLLRFGEKSFFSRELFLDEAKKWFSSCDFLILSNTDINDFSQQRRDPLFLRKYKEFERLLRTELMHYRQAQKKQMEYKVKGEIAQAILEGTPLDKEIKLLKLRWDFVEEFTQGHYSDLPFFLSYFLKLQILERLLVFNKERGKEKFIQICEVTL